MLCVAAKFNQCSTAPFLIRVCAYNRFHERRSYAELRVPAQHGLLSHLSTRRRLLLPTHPCMAGLKSGAVQLRRGLERKSSARPACSSAHRPGGWRLNEGSGDVGEAIAEKLVKLLSSDAASSLHSVPLPLLEAPDAELRGAKLLGLDRFRLRPDDPARVLRTDKHLLVHIPLQVQDLNVTGKYTALRPHVITKGKFKARLQCLHIYTEIAICSSRPKLETLEVMKMEGLSLMSAKGMTVFLNWMLLTVIDNFVNRNQAQLFRMIREASWKAFAVHVMSVLPHLDVRYITKKQPCHHEELN